MTCEWGEDRKEKYVRWYRQLSTQNEAEVIAKVFVVDMAIEPDIPYQVMNKVSDDIISYIEICKRECFLRGNFRNSMFFTLALCSKSVFVNVSLSCVMYCTASCSYLGFSLSIVISQCCFIFCHISALSLLARRVHSDTKFRITKASSNLGAASLLFPLPVL